MQTEEELLPSLDPTGQVHAVSEGSALLPCSPPVGGDRYGTVGLASQDQAVATACLVDSAGFVVWRGRGDDIGRREFEDDVLGVFLDNALAVILTREVRFVGVDDVAVARL